MKIKLRDMTKEQYKKWSEAKCAETKCCYCLFQPVYCDEDKDLCWVNHKEIQTSEFLDQEIEIEDKPILTEEEREYLSAVIKPFRDKVEYIGKIPVEAIKKAEFIQIGYNGEWFSLPCFEPGEYYKNMEFYKKYSLEELGL